MNQYYDQEKFDARKLAMHEMSMREVKQPYGPAQALMARVSGDAPAQGGGLDPKTLQKAQMLAAIGAAGGVGCGPVTGQGCAPMAYPASVVQSVMDKQCRTDLGALGQASNVPVTLDTIMALINTAKYATSPARLGWQCDSLTFSNTTPGQAPVIAANAAFGPINVTPTKSFAADSLVSAAGTANDTQFFMTSLSYDSTNYVDNSPWYAPYYTAAAACCLCVRSLKIIEKATTVSLSGFNGTTANLHIVAQLFGETLFGGNP
jgi:hypothetical protein